MRVVDSSEGLADGVLVRRDLFEGAAPPHEVKARWDLLRWLEDC
jgi:hypothetical protein